MSGLRPPGAGAERKLSSGIARPQGLPRPASKLQQPGSYLRLVAAAEVEDRDDRFLCSRTGLPMRGAPGGGRAPSQNSGRGDKAWLEDCY